MFKHACELQGNSIHEISSWKPSAYTWVWVIAFNYQTWAWYRSMIPAMSGKLSPCQRRLHFDVLFPFEDFEIPREDESCHILLLQWSWSVHHAQGSVTPCSFLTSVHWEHWLRHLCSWCIHGHDYCSIAAASVASVRDSTKKRFADGVMKSLQRECIWSWTWQGFEQDDWLNKPFQKVAENLLSQNERHRSLPDPFACALERDRRTNLYSNAGWNVLCHVRPSQAVIACQ